MNSQDKMVELITQMYSDMQEGFKQVNKRIDNVEKEVKKNKYNHRA
jgi:tetrahydromethanopterin S-methyltransferase subunit G